MERKLIVGDVLYEKGGYGILAVHKIERVTATQAISKYNKWRIETISDGKAARIIGSPGWDYKSYYLETPELKRELWRQKSLVRIKEFPYYTLLDESIEKILEIFDSTRSGIPSKATALTAPKPANEPQK